VYKENLGGSLFSEARKSYQHFISDEIVQLCDAVDPHEVSSFPELYERGDMWLEVLIRSSAYHVVAVVSLFGEHICEICAGRSGPEMSSLCNGNLRPNGDTTVLVDSIERMKAPQWAGGKLRPCRSIVWLKRFNVCNSRLAQPVNLSGEPVYIPPDQGFLLKDRELTGFGIGSGTVVNQRPDSLIQGCAQTLEVVAANQIDVHMGLLSMDSVANLIPFRFFLGDHGMGVGTEFVHGLSQSVQVTLRPLGLVMSIG
jgi:hypothetical protein